MQNVERLASAVFRAQSRLFGLQQREGFWVGELEANSTLCSDYVAFMHWSACVDPDRQAKCVDHLLSAQLADGGWSTYPGGPARLDLTVKAYFALKLAGFESSDRRMDRAANLVRKLGGIEHTRSYTRFYLALLGQVRWQDVPPIPIEVVLAPHWFPLNLYSVSAWTRVMMVPLGIIRHLEPTQAIPLERGIPELFITPERRVRSVTDDWFSKGLTLLAWAQRLGVFLSRKAPLAAAEQWMLERMGEGCSGLGAIFPSMLQALMALRCLGYATQSAAYRKAEAAFEQLFVDDANGFRS
jgi:squalene-hopene/tetraprenyl-beta-curcumene cyclase